MKVIKNELNDNDFNWSNVEYPVLITYNDSSAVLLVDGYNGVKKQFKGIVIHTGYGCDTLGRYDDSWTSIDAELYNGTITLSND